MGANAEKIPILKDLIAQQERQVSRDRFPASTISCGVLRGALTEISGTAKLEWVIQFLKENPTLKVFWLERDFSLFPPALYQRGLDPSRFIFAECKDEVFITLRKALRCQVFECIITPSVFKEEKILKALQLLAERANASVFLLSEELQSSWPISMQFEVHRSIYPNELEIRLHKNKRGNKSMGTVE